MLYALMVDIKKLPKSEIEVTISVPWSQWEGEIASVVEGYSKDMKISGFRPGKAPREVVEQKVGKEVLLSEASEHAIQKSWEQTIQAEKIEAIGQPKAEVLKLAEGNDLEYKITTAVLPEVTLKEGWRDEMKKVNAENAKKEDVKIDETLIEKEIQRLAESRAKLITVDRKAQKNDNIQVDFQVFRDNVPVENGTSKNHNLVLGSGVFIPGFEEQVTGMSAGEEKEFELEFPKEYHEKSLAGRKATFKTKVNVVQERQIPELNDAFAASLGKFETMDALKKSMAEGMEKEEQQKQKDEKRGKVLDVLVDHIEGEIPDVMIEEELRQMMAHFEGQVQMMGMPFEDYLKQMKKSREDLEKEWRPQAEKKVQSGLAVAHVGKEQEIEPESSEIEEEMNKTLARYKHMKDAKKDVDMKKLHEYSKNVVTSEKVMEYLESL